MEILEIYSVEILDLCKFSALAEKFERKSFLGLGLECDKVNLCKNEGLGYTNYYVFSGVFSDSPFA